MEMKVCGEEVEKEDSKYGKFKEYEIKDAARTIIEAEEIKKDKEKMKYVKICLENKSEAASNAIKTIADIRKAADDMPNDDDDD